LSRQLQLAQTNLAIKIAIFPTMLQYSAETNIRFDCKHCNYFSIRKHKCPLSGGKVPFAFVKNVVQIAFCMIAVPTPPTPSPIFPEKFFKCTFYSKFIFQVHFLLHFLFPQSFDASYAPASHPLESGLYDG
jgi:hypothetical protein